MGGRGVGGRVEEERWEEGAEEAEEERERKTRGRGGREEEEEFLAETKGEMIFS